MKRETDSGSSSSSSSFSESNGRGKRTRTRIRTTQERPSLRATRRRRTTKKIKKRGNGKVARMPKVLRDRINQMIADGMPYSGIRNELGKEGEQLTEQNLHNWKKWGYQDWVSQQERLEHMRAIREFAMEAAKESEGSEMQEAGLQLAATQVYELLMDFEPKSLKEKLKGDPQNYARIVNALTRLSDGGLKFERYRAEVAEAKARIEKELARAEFGGGISPETRRRVEQELNLM